MWKKFIFKDNCNIDKEWKIQKYIYIFIALIII